LSLTTNTTQSRSLVSTNHLTDTDKAVQEITETKTMQNTAKQKLVNYPGSFATTLCQEMRWAYSTILLSSNGANRKTALFTGTSSLMHIRN